MGSSYRRQRRPQIPQPQPHPPTQPNNELCSYCGTKGHGKSAPTKVRRKDCPAFGTRCDSCDREHHFGKMCRSRGDNRAVRGQQESALFDTLSTITSRQHSNSIDHHTYSQSTLSWKRTQSKSQPFLTISLQTQAEDYIHLGHTLRAPQRRITVQAMADTGCQSCLAGTTTMKRLGLKTTDLLPVSLKMHAANNSKILGAILVKIAEPQGQRSSRQMVYITDHVSSVGKRALTSGSSLLDSRPPSVPQQQINPRQSHQTRHNPTHQGHAPVHDAPSRHQSSLSSHTQPQRTTETNSRNSSLIGTRPAPSIRATTSLCLSWMDHLSA